MKMCAVCKKELDEKEFIGKNGRSVNTCKTCREIKLRRYLANRDRELLRMRKYKNDNKDRLKEYLLSWRKENVEYVKAYRKKYNEENRSTIIQYKKKEGITLAKYIPYAEKLTCLESPREGVTGELIVLCAHCGKEFSPTNSSVRHRISSLNRADGKERRLYCSEECKNLCEVFNKKSDPAERASRRERDRAWAKKIKQRVNYVCERCGSKEKLEAHHEIAVKVDSTKASSLDNGICLCHECHMKVHSESGCTLIDLRRI